MVDAKKNRTALHAAAKVVDDPSVFLFLKERYKLDPHAKDHKGIKPLHIALKKGNIELASLLCTDNKTLYELTPEKESLMFFAAASGKIEAVDFLLALENKDPKANFSFLNHLNKQGQTALGYALGFLNKEDGRKFFLDLLSRGFQISEDNSPTYMEEISYIVSLFVTAKSPERENILNTYLKSEWIDLELCRDKTLLEWAISENNLEVAQYALQRGAQINPQISSEVPLPPLHLAIKEQNEPMIELLLNHEADCLAVDHKGRTALKYLRELYEARGYISWPVLYLLRRALQAKIIDVTFRVATSILENAQWGALRLQLGDFTTIKYTN
jgi:hypothetical protein